MENKEINSEWANIVLNEMSKSEYSGDLPEIEWLRGGKDFKRQLAFKVLPANSKENKIFSWIIGTHWLTVGNTTKRFVCPEQTPHLKKAGVKCPICEAKRRLLQAGFTEDELCTQGKFGPIPVFDPRIQSNVKVIVAQSDTRTDWDRSHISILQQNGSFLTKWLVEKYTDREIPDFLVWENSNYIKFSRPSDNSKWDREVSFAQYKPTPEMIARLKDENEALTMSELWKLPDDQSIVEVTNMVKELEDKYREAKNAFTSNVENSNPSNTEDVDIFATESSTNSAVYDDDIPF